MEFAGGSVHKSKHKYSESNRNLWVSSLSSATRASELKKTFSKYGKVIGAKIFTNTKSAGGRCYGYVTMLSYADAISCIQHLNQTELHGRIISVETTKHESSTLPRLNINAFVKIESQEIDDNVYTSATANQLTRVNSTSKIVHGSKIHILKRKTQI